MAGRDLFADEGPAVEAIAPPVMNSSTPDANPVGRDLFADEQPPIKEKLTQLIVDQKLGKLTDPRKAALLNELTNRQSLMAMFEPAITLATGALALPVSGVAGIAGSLWPGAEGQGERAVKATQEAMTYQPRTPEGQQVLEEVGGVIEPIGSAVKSLEDSLGEFAFDVTGSPAIAAAAATTPTLVGEILGIASLKSLRVGTKLKVNGEATRTLKKQLHKDGLDYDTLHPLTKESIPDMVDETLLPGGNPVKPEAKLALVNEIKNGSRNDALATLKVEGNNLKPDPVGIEAVKQGFRPGVVQAVKTASASTKAKMKEMLRIRKSIKNNERIALDTRPDIVIGDEITSRIGFIRDKMDVARKQLNDIATDRLPGMEIDATEVRNVVKNHMDDLGVEFTPDVDGLPNPSFNNSLISEDFAAQRSIKALFRLMKKGGRPDALRFHRMKRELDNLINWQKSSSSGLTEAGRRVLKDVRGKLNETLGNLDPEYASVNKVLSSSLDAMQNLDKSVGSIDILGEGANKALGTRMRALMSNQTGRVKIENSIEDINRVARDLGGVFDVDIKDLVLFDNALAEQYGAVARTSLAGQAEQAASSAISQSPKSSVLNAVGKMVGKGVEKARGINEFNSFEILDKLLK